MKIFLLIVVSAILGLAASIHIYMNYNIAIPPILTGLPITAIGYMLFKNWLTEEPKKPDDW